MTDNSRHLNSQERRAYDGTFHGVAGSTPVRTRKPTEVAPETEDRIGDYTPPEQKPVSTLPKR